MQIDERAMQIDVKRRRRGGREGSALIITMLMAMSLMVLALIVSQDALGRSRATADETGATSALWAAEAGIGMKVNDLEATAGAAMASLTLNLADGAVCTVECVEEGEYVRITAVGVANPGTPGEVRRSIEAYVNPSFHPLFYKATYVGNSDADGRLVDDYALTFGPNLPTVQGGSSFNENNWYSRNTAMSEVDHQVDFNGDGDLGDAPTLNTMYNNRVAWGWSGFMSSSGNSRKLDINKNGTYADTVIAPTVTTQPAPRDPTLDNPAATTDSGWASAGPEIDADYVEGDVYVNGDVTMNGGTDVFGDVDASGDGDSSVAGANGDVTGAPVTGTSTSQSTYIAPPDLADPLGTGQSYESIADEIVTTTSSLPGYVRGEQAASTYGAGLGPVGTHDNPHFHLQNGSSSTLSFGNSRDGDLILVKGNLWIHDLSSFTIDMPTGSNVQLTIVVEGNLYIADDLNYTNGDNALLFIVKGSDANPESYVDENRNYAFDAGEQIMNDDGDGTYEGPREGQGNVFFGDPRYGTGGVTDGYIYAQNNVYMVNPPVSASPPTAQDRIFGVYGFLSAGGIMDLGPRAGGNNYNNFRVKYDPRIQNGEVTFKGMPSTLGGGWQGLSVLSWREVQ